MSLEDIKNYRLAGEFVKFLIRHKIHEQVFKKALQLEFPQIFSQLESSYNNPDCSCINKVVEHINNNKESAMLLLYNNFLTIPDVFEDYIKKFEESFSLDISGKMYTIPVDGWNNFYNEIKYHRFRTFAVTKEGNLLYVFFL